MKTKLTSIQSGALLLLLCNPGLQLSTLAQGTAFTYQGRLNSGGASANGSYDLRFRLFVDPFGNNQSGSASLLNAVPVANGLFTVALDFGPGVFNGSNYWLEVDVKTNGAGAYTDLSPLQPLTPTPYAIFAGNLAGGLAGTYSNAVTFNNASNLFGGTFIGNGSGLTNANAATLGGLSAAGFWKISGNAGTAPGTNFLGTTDPFPLELWVNRARVLRLEPDTNNIGAPNLIGGAPNNFVDPGVYGATIAGGGVLNYLTNGYEPGPGSNHVSAVWGTIGGGRRNTVAADHSTIAGGHDNEIQIYAYDSAIGGGEFNVISNYYGQSAIAGGLANHTAAYGASIGGGYYNSVSSGGYGTVGGGYFNTSRGYSATIPGGYANVAQGDYSFAAGLYAAADHPGAFVWADASAFATFSSTTSNQFSVRATGGARFVTAGQGMSVDGPVQAPSFQGGGAGLTSLNAANLTSGTLPDARLSANVPLLNATLNTFASDIALSGGAGYHFIQLSGGNSLGFLYGSYPRWSDGIHLGYNYYADALGGSHIINIGGGTSRISVGYDSIVLATGDTGVQPTYQNVVIGGTITTVNGTFQNLSDRNAKRDFTPVSPAQILDKVARLPISEWSYKEEAHTRHIGPVSQDFHSLFHLGTDERHITPMDEGGVALAAIRGLNEKLDAKSKLFESGNQDADARIQKLEVENAELKHQNESLEKRLEALEQMVLRQKAN